MKYDCDDCGKAFESAVYKQGLKRCDRCTEKAAEEGKGPDQMKQKIEGMVRDGVGVRELKANPSEILKLLEENPGLEFVITRYGKPSAKLVSLRGQKEEVPWDERTSLRNAWANLHQLSDEDFLEAKQIWEPQISESNDDTQS